MSHNGDTGFIIEGLQRLKNKITDPEKPRQLQNKIASIAAMKCFLKVQVPKILKNHELTIIKSPKTKSVFINQVEVIVSPDIIFTMNYKGEKYMGGVKIHLSKGNIFEPKDSKMVAAIMQKYLETIGNNYKAKVLPELCMSLDVFDERILSSPSNIDAYLDRINLACSEVKRFWSVA